MKSRRLGQFSLDWKTVNNAELSGDIFRKLEFVPLRVECIGYSATYHYVGISPEFKEVSEGQEAPVYAVLFEFNEDDDEFNVNINAK